jgi:hypothetical protein
VARTQMPPAGIEDIDRAGILRSNQEAPI